MAVRALRIEVKDSFQKLPVTNELKVLYDVLKFKDSR